MARPINAAGEVDIAELERLARVGLSQSQIADWFGFSERTLRNRFQSDPDLVAAYKKGKAEGVGKVADTLFQQAMGGNITAMIFYLKTQGRWTEVQKVEHTVQEAPVEPEERLSRVMELLGDRSCP